jgi:subtilisin family serine protease
VIVDTGLVEGAAEQHSWLVGVTGDVDQPVGADGTLMQDGGHGTFTAGCLRAAAPRAEVRVVDGTRLLTRKADAVGTIGAAYEGDLAQLIRAGLTDTTGRLDVPDVLLVNFAGPTLDDRPPPALTALHDDLLQHLRELLVVAPAGNEGDTTRNWPASFPWVVGVGAVGPNWRDRATWSNHGPTTDVFAPGADIVNAFASGTYVYTWAGPRQGTRAEFAGLARWSGTSFAAPLVAGLVATRMSSSGQTSRRAWKSLLDLAESQPVSGTGPVLYPGQG